MRYKRAMEKYWEQKAQAGTEKGEGEKEPEVWVNQTRMCGGVFWNPVS